MSAGQEQMLRAVCAGMDRIREAAGVGPEVEIDELVDEVGRLAQDAERLHSWAGLMNVLDEHWPAEVFRGQSRDSDPGPRIVALVRAVDVERASRQAWAAEAMRLQQVIDETVARLREAR